MNDQLMYDHVTNEIRKTVPRFKVVSKSKSMLMRVIGKIFFFNKEFMSSYFTTIYPNVYSPETSLEKFRWTVLSHEWVHLLRAKQNVLAFSFRYLFPVSLAVFSVLSLLAIWGSSYWLLNLLWLVVAALPIPSYPRAYEERIAYRMSLAVELWRYGNITQGSKDFIALQFTSGAYYYMWPFKKMVKRWVDKEEQDITSGKYNSMAPYSVMYDLIKQEKAGLLKPLE